MTMKLLFDTHTAIWWFDDSERIGPTVRRTVLDDMAPVAVSIASLWELTIKHRLGKFPDLADRIAEACQLAGFELLDLRIEHLRALRRLPIRRDHRDPFDHLLLAQAAAEGAVLVSHDSKVEGYGIPILRCGA